MFPACEWGFLWPNWSNRYVSRYLSRRIHGERRGDPLRYVSLTRKQEDVTGATGLQSFIFSSVNVPFGESATSADTLSSLLERTSLPYITSTEQIQLAVIVDCMSEVETVV